MADGRPLSFSALVKASQGGVVNISTTVAVPDHPLDGIYGARPGAAQSLGTGFVVDSDGLVLTNHHVIRGAQLIRVRMSDEREYGAEVVGTDPKTDLALIRILDPPVLRPLPLGDSDAVEVGEWVLAIGNPMGLSSSVTAGIVSAKGRSDVPIGGEVTYVDFIQTDASINPGNSGGPLIDMEGRVVGIAAAISKEGQGIGFAIPINMAKEIMPQLKADGKVSRSWLGIYVGAVSDKAASSAGLDRPRGAVVRKVIPGGPAATAGLKVDDIIHSFDGEPLDDVAALRWKSGLAGEGHKARLIVRRGTADVALDLVLARNPNE